MLAKLTLMMLLSACSSNGKQWDPEDYTVKSGDTIYAIAWRYELDPEVFAAWNGISASKLIKPGQRLHTRKPENFDANQVSNQDKNIAYVPQTKQWQSASSSPEKIYQEKTYPEISASGNTYSKPQYSDSKWLKVKKGDNLYAISRQTGVSVERLAQLNQLKKPYTIKPGQTIFLKPLNTQVNAAGGKTTKIITSSSQSSGQNSGQGSHKTRHKTEKRADSHTKKSSSQKISWPKKVHWQRPAEGKIIKKYNRNRNDAKGIDIAGKQGDAIVAAASGKVVYSGSGLISYGKLVIIKHNKTYLSAYAYNRKLLVKEGDRVKAGQKIAEMGHKDKLGTRLHFEIRKNGKPVDPLKYLPW